MRYELTDDEWTAIKPMLPNKPRGKKNSDGDAMLQSVSLPGSQLGRTVFQQHQALPA
jgi:transposase